MFCVTMGDVDAETLVNTIQNSLPEVEAQTRHKVADLKIDKVGGTLRDVKCASQVYLSPGRYAF